MNDDARLRQKVYAETLALRIQSKSRVKKEGWEEISEQNQWAHCAPLPKINHDAPKQERAHRVL